MNSKKRFLGIALIVTSALFLLSCVGTTVTQGENWLASKTDKPEMDVSGTWTSPEWGTATFKQDGKNVTGVLGDYPARGVVSGNVLYLMMYAGEKADYFAELKATDLNNFNGVYSKYKPVDEVRKDPGYTKPMSLTKGAPK
jgi:hypothetical protein